MSRRTSRRQLSVHGDEGQVMTEYALVLTIMVASAIALPPIAVRVTALVNIVAGLLH